MRKGLLSKWYNQLTIEHIWALAAVAGVFIYLNLQPIRPHDFWWHMAVGREIVQIGHIPTVDTFSQTMRGQPYPSYNMFWMMDVFFYLVYSLGGAALIVFANSVLITSAYAIVLYLCKQITGSLRLAAFSLLFAAALGLNDWNVRPQAATFVLGALFLLAIHKLGKDGHRLWLLVFPLSMLVWVNSHGTFFIGLGLIGLWLADRAWRGWRDGSRKLFWDETWLPMVALLAAGLAALFNPRGLGIVGYLVQMLGSSPVQTLVPEWAAPSFDTLHGALFLLGLLFSAAVLSVSPKRPTLLQLLTFLFFAALGLKTSRGIVWFGLVMAPVLAEHFLAMASVLPRSTQPKEVTQAVSRRLNALFAGLILLMVMITLPWFKESLPLPELKRGLISEETPVEATQFLLENHLPKPIFHNMAYGSYLIWAAQPDYPVFVDSRIELYSYEHWIDYIQISNAQRDWKNILDQYGIRTMILSRQEQSALVLSSMESSLWQVVFQNSESVLLTRKITSVDP